MIKSLTHDSEFHNLIHCLIFHSIFPRLCLLCQKLQSYKHNSVEYCKHLHNFIHRFCEKTTINA